jgi:hypothetical protein
VDPARDRGVRDVMLPPSLVVPRARLVALVLAFATLATVAVIVRATSIAPPAPRIVVVHEQARGHDDGPLSAIVRVVDDGHAATMPGCGYLDVWTAVEYEIVEVRSGPVPAQDIWVDVECPGDLSRRGMLHVGQVDDLTLVPTTARHGTRVPRGAPHYHAIRVD